MNEYIALKEKHQKEVNEFPFGFAFSQDQFEKMMEEFGLAVNDTDKIFSIGGGGYIKRTDADAFHEMMERQEEERKAAVLADKTGSKYIYQMWSYELANHEFGYTEELEDTLDACGYTLEEVLANKALRAGLNKALKKYGSYYCV